MEKISKIRFSPEIEVEFPDTRSDYRDNDGDEDEDYSDDYDELPNINIKNEGIHGWDKKEDCSLDYGLEFCPEEDNKLYFNRNGLKQIDKLVKIIKKKKGFANSNCGLHIHVDTSKLSKEKIEKLGKLFYENQDYIYNKWKIKQNRLGFCSKLNSEYIPYGSSKDHGITLSTFKTLEFRIFNGSLDYKYIKTCIKWALEFVCNERI